ncbi:MAG: class I SAM-dependent methyltransferase [Anaerolineae bacterium]|nr:class I SAM-dependent methyltransferase [Anaerolineae bacterium]
MTDKQQQVYFTARTTPDHYGLGRTGGQRGAEILAGLRAELIASPESKALCRASGRVIARMVLSMARNPAQVNFVAGRPAAFGVVIGRELAQNKPEPVLVEIAAGFSPRGLELARKNPGLRVIEIDLPGVIEEKRNRLRQARFDIPRNITWKSADLGVTPLFDVLKGDRADVVAAEGLTAYFRPAEVTRMAAEIRLSLKAGGIYMCDVNWQEGHKTFTPGLSRFFKREAGEFLCMTETKEAACNLLVEAGYKAVTAYLPSALTADLPEVPKPVHDFSLVIVSRIF